MSSTGIEILEDKVTGYLVDLGLPPEPHGDGLYAFRYDQTVVLVSLFEAAGTSWVRLASALLRDFRPTLDLVTRLLRLNTEVLLGSFLIFEDDTLSFSVTLPGNGLEAHSFTTALEHVASISNSFAEELKSIAGGQLPSDLLPE
jgi:hypothetical protein